MDLDIENDLVVFECEVCGFKSEFRGETSASINALTEDWCIQFLEVRGGMVRIMTCPTCAELDHGQIFEGFQCRVRAGADLRYH